MGHSKQYPSYWQAILSRAMRDTMSSFLHITTWITFIVEWIIGLVVTVSVLHRFRGGDAMMDFLVEIGIAAPVTAIIVFAIHLAFHWASAPRHVFRDQCDLLRARDEAMVILRKEVFALQRQIDSQGPVLKGHIEAYVIGSTPNAPMIVATVTIANLGGPSIAQNWAMRLETKSGESHGQLEWIPEEMRMFDTGSSSQFLIPGQEPPQPARVIRSKDAIYNIAMKAIPRGEKVIGYLMATFALDRDQVQEAGNKLTIDFQDVNNTACSCTAIIGESPVPLSKAARYPGENV